MSLALLTAAAQATQGDVKRTQARGAHQLIVVGTFGGTSLQFKMLGPDAATWLPIGAAVNAAGVVAVTLPFGAAVKADLTGGDGTTSIHAVLESVE